jgi:hypothetical protein
MPDALRSQVGSDISLAGFFSESNAKANLAPFGLFLWLEKERIGTGERVANADGKRLPQYGIMRAHLERKS